jgi:hypothetical protein
VRSGHLTGGPHLTRRNRQRVDWFRAQLGTQRQPPRNLFGVDKMTEEAVATAWWDLTASRPNAQERFRLIRSAIRQLLPSDVDSAAVTFVADEPVVIAVSGVRVFCVHIVVREDDAPTRAVVRSLPLDSAVVTIEAADSNGTLPDGTQAAIRSWNFTWSDGSVLAFSTALKRFGWDDGPDLGEAVATAMAGKLGWALPSTSR